MARPPMTRRDAAWLVVRAATLAGAPEFLERWLRAAQNHTHQTRNFAPPEPDRWTSYQPQFFSREDYEMLDAFMSIIIPTDETPGAREAHVAAFADFFVNAAAEFAPEVQRQWRNAVRYLRDQHFGQLAPEAQLTFLEQMSEPERNPTAAHEGFDTYRLIKDMTVHAFYTSRIGLIDVLEYQGNAYLTEFPGCTHVQHQKV